jgi:hypothetical protein
MFKFISIQSLDLVFVKPVKIENLYKQKPKLITLMINSYSVMFRL